MQQYETEQNEIQQSTTKQSGMKQQYETEQNEIQQYETEQYEAV